MVFLISQTNGCTYTLDGNHQTLLMYHPLYKDGSYETNRGAYEYVRWFGQPIPIWTVRIGTNIQSLQTERIIRRRNHHLQGTEST